VMSRSLSVLLVVLLLAAPAAGATLASTGEGFAKLMDELFQGDEATANNAGGRVTGIGLPPMLSGLFRRTQEQAISCSRVSCNSFFNATMRFPRLALASRAGPSLSRPLKELSIVSNSCEFCSRVQSRMRSMSIIFGPNGQRVETFTEVGGCVFSEHCRVTAACRVCCSTFYGCLSAARAGRHRGLVLKRPSVASCARPQPTCLRFGTET
jgi:hypothetical protein